MQALAHDTAMGWPRPVAAGRRAAVAPTKGDHVQLRLQAHIEESKAWVRRITLHMLHEACAKAG